MSRWLVLVIQGGGVTMYEPNQRPQLRVRSDGVDVVLTLDAQQARELARAIDEPAASREEWLDEAARTLNAMADHLRPTRPAGERRQLRTPGYPPVAKPSRPRAPRSAAPPPAPPTERPDASPAAPTSARTSARRASAAPAPAKPASGLAAAVAVFAEAVTVGEDTQPVSVLASARKTSSSEDRARQLQEILDAAARTSSPVPAQS